MTNMSHFEILTGDEKKFREKIKKYISEMQFLVHLIDVNIEIEQKRVAARSGAVTVRQLKARRDNLTATISDLRKMVIRPARGTRSTATIH
jgi:hypothetical protein